MMRKLALLVFFLSAIASSSYAEYLPGYSGSGNGLTSADPKWIVTADDLRSLRNQVNAGTEPSGRYYVLSKDVNLIYTDYRSIGNANYGRAFSGHFDGNNRTIYVQIHPLKEDDEELLSQDRALFGYIRTTGDYAVKNLHVGGYARGYNAAGIVSILNAGEILNCTVSGDFSAFSIVGDEEEENKINAGGIVAYMSGGVVSNCVFSGNVSADGGDFHSRAGGIAGIMSGGHILRSTVKHYARISASGNTDDGNPENAGGIAGFVAVEDVDPNDGEDTITYCTFEGGEITSTHYAGGITGYARGGQYTHNTVGSDTRISATRVAGGIAGRLESGGYIFSNDIEGGIVSSDTSSAGGVVGYLMLGYVKENSSNAAIRGSSPYKGGVVGHVDNIYGNSNNVTGNSYKGSDYAIGKDEHGNLNTNSGGTKQADSSLLYFITPPTLQEANENERYTGTIELSQSAELDLSPIPSWMNPVRDGAVISLSGIPTVPGSVSFDLTVSYGYQTIRRNFGIKVNPQLTINNADDVTAKVGDNVNISLSVSARSYDISHASFSWSVSSGDLPSGLSKSTSTGNTFSISGTLREAGIFRRIITVTPSNVSLSPVSASITIYAGPDLSIKTTEITSPIKSGREYSFDIETEPAASESMPVAWSVSSGALPEGIILGAFTGHLSGTPRTPGNYAFTILANTGTVSADRAFTLRVDPAISITTASALPYASRGEFYSQDISHDVPAGNPIVWSIKQSSDLPPGLSFNSGRISGIVRDSDDVPGDYTFNIVLKAGGFTDSKDFTLKVTDFSVSSDSVLNIPSGRLYSYSFDVRGVSRSLVTWSADTSGLPSGLVFYNSSGTLSGTTSADGAYSLTVQASAGDIKARRTVTLNVLKAITITTSSTLPYAIAGIAYSQNFSHDVPSGNTLNWEVISGSLPPRISLNSETGILSGTTGEAGVYPFTVRLTAGLTTSKDFTLRVLKVSVSGDTVLPYAIVGQYYSHQLSADISGFSSLTWSADNTQLPSGLRLSTSGLISGTPISAGRRSFVVHAIASSDVSADKVLTLTVREASALPSVVILTESLPPGEVGRNYSADLSASVPGAVWTHSGGLLPPGLTLSTSGVLAGVPTVSGSFMFSLGASAPSYSTGYHQYTVTISGGASGSSSSGDLGSSGGGGGGCESGAGVTALMASLLFIVKKKK